MAEKLREKVCLMNMCVVMDDKGNVVALDKVGSHYTGITFPGGHVEKGESFDDSIIREIKEETGLTIRNPKLMGLYHWNENDIHNVGLMYKCNDFEGELVSSHEGRVYWVPFEELKKTKVARGTEFVIKMVEDDSINEVYIHLNEEGYTGEVFKVNK